MRRLLLIIFAVALLPGCFVFHDDYPSNSCEGNGDCFAAQGEVCNTTTGECEQAPPVDAMLPPPDGNVDAAVPDAQIDAPVPDATVSDARVNDAM